MPEKKPGILRRAVSAVGNLFLRWWREATGPLLSDDHPLLVDAILRRLWVLTPVLLLALLLLLPSLPRLSTFSLPVLCRRGLRGRHLGLPLRPAPLQPPAEGHGTALDRGERPERLHDHNLRCRHA
jgi:hypothetical protein